MMLPLCVFLHVTNPMVDYVYLSASGGEELRQNVDAATATEELFSIYKGDVYRYARFTLGNPSAAEDIVQEVFIRVLRSWDRFRGEASTKTWLWTIIRSCIVDYQRKNKRKLQQIPFEDDMGGVEHLKSQSLLETEELLRQLNEDQREVIVLRIVQDWSTRDTARILGWSKPKVKTTLHRALEKLRQGGEDYVKKS